MEGRSAWSSASREATDGRDAAGDGGGGRRRGDGEVAVAVVGRNGGRGGEEWPNGVLGDGARVL